MMKKFASQLSTLAVVILVILFCFPSMASCGRKESPTETYTEPPTDATTPPPTQTTIPPTAPPETTEPSSAPAEPTPIPLTTAPEGYFSDALFIGDSRTVGLQEYGSIPEACYFATSGMSVYDIFYEKVAGSTFEDLMASRQFGKIYVMLGINELGYDRDQTVAEYEKLIGWIREKQPEAMVYVEANLHVSASRSNTDRIYNNKNLDAFNARISALADGQRIFYLDVNPLFDDGQGNLSGSYTADDTHVLGKYYRVWTEWIAENAAVPQT